MNRKMENKQTQLSEPRSEEDILSTCKGDRYRKESVKLLCGTKEGINMENDRKMNE